MRLAAAASLFQIVFQYGKDPKVTAMMDKIDLAILPVFNVDGYAYTWTKVRFTLHRMTFIIIHHSEILCRFQANPNS